MSKEEEAKAAKVAGMHVTQALGYTEHQVEILASLVTLLGLYDLLYFFDAARFLGWPRLFPVIGVRYFFILPTLLLLREVARRLKRDTETQQSEASLNWNYPHYVRSAVVLVCGIGVILLGLVAPPALRRCETPRSMLRPCDPSLFQGAAYLTYANQVNDDSIPDSSTSALAPSPPLLVAPPPPELSSQGFGFGAAGECFAVDEVSSGQPICAVLISSEYLKTLGFRHKSKVFTTPREMFHVNIRTFVHQQIRRTPYSWMSRLRWKS